MNSGLFLVLLGIALVQGQYVPANPSSSSDMYGNINARYLRGYMGQRQNSIDGLKTKLESICPGKGVEFEETLDSVKKCVNEIDESEETLCSMIKHNFLKCSKPMIKVLKDCFPETIKDTPDFVFKSFASMTDYICKVDGEHILELMNPCVMTPNSGFARCERRIRTKVQQFQRKVPSKTTICEVSHTLRPCIESYLKSSCGHHITRDAVLGLFDSAFAPCTEINEIDDMELETSTSDTEVIGWR